MDKTFFFMAGLPRSGSTLLSAILNQNPDVYVGPHTDFPRMMLALYHETQRSETFHAGYNPDGFANLLKELPSSFYSNIDKKYIIDKNRTWGTIDNIKLLDLLSHNVKIICPVRPILEILASFVQLADKNPNNFIDKKLGEIPAGYYRPKNDARCDLMMAHTESLEHDIFSLATALQPEHAHKFHFVLYEDLIKNPTETIDSLYGFLRIPKYKHNFQNLHWVKMPYEEQVFGIADMHSVNPKIKPSNTDISILSDYVRNKYAHTLDFLNPLVKL